MKCIRNSVKAIIIKDGKLLAVKAKDKDGFFYILPGGGQNHSETMHETLRRECLEEIGCRIKIKKLLLIREYLGKNHEFAEFDNNVHQIEFMFDCELEKDEIPITGHLPDKDQVGIEWLDIRNILNYRLYPQSIREKIIDNEKREGIYCGDVN